MASRRMKDIAWEPGDDKGNAPTWERVIVALLMDVRDEMKELNRTLNCPNTREIPRVLRQIRANTANLPKTGKRGRPRES